MERSTVAVATMTWARSPSEQLLLRRAVAQLAASGMPVAVADRGEDAAFLAFLQSLPSVTVVVPPVCGLIAQVKASMELAARYDLPFILYTEPDKEAFITHELGAFVDAAPDEPGIGVVLAARSAHSFSTFPPTRRYVEEIVNARCSAVLGSIGDYTYGPFLMNRALLPVFGCLNGELGWGWRLKVLRAAQQRGLRIVHQCGDYGCPIEQRAEDDEERRHCLRQMRQNLAALEDRAG